MPNYQVEKVYEAQCREKEEKKQAQERTMRNITMVVRMSIPVEIKIPVTKEEYAILFDGGEHAWLDPDNIGDALHEKVYDEAKKQGEQMEAMSSDDREFMYVSCMRSETGITLCEY